MTIGENIKKYRRAAMLTQHELAEKCECAAGTIQQYELGKRQPRIEQLKKIALALSVQVSDLIGGYTGEPTNISPEYPIAFPGLERKAAEIGYNIRYIYNQESDDYSTIVIDYPDGSTLSVSISDIENLNTETDIYLKFRLEELRNKIKE